LFGHSVNRVQRNCRIRETIPLISFDDSIDFVQQFHWFRSTIPLTLFPEIAKMASAIQRFSPLILQLLPNHIEAMACVSLQS
jgi:hypothetical protein